MIADAVREAHAQHQHTIQMQREHIAALESEREAARKHDAAALAAAPAELAELEARVTELRAQIKAGKGGDHETQVEQALTQARAELKRLERTKPTPLTPA